MKIVSKQRSSFHLGLFLKSALVLACFFQIYSSFQVISFAWICFLLQIWDVFIDAFLTLFLSLFSSWNHYNVNLGILDVA